MNSENYSNREFRKIKSLQFLYEINGDGTILRNVKSKKHIKIKLDLHHSKVGYYSAWVSIKGKVHRVSIHKAVAECWLGDCPEGYEVDHIDRNSHNNNYTNLRYVTHSQQMKNRVLGDRIIEQAINNCLQHSLTCLAKPTILINTLTNEKLEFRSMTKASEYLASLYNKNVDYIRSKMKQCRSHIYDFEVIYNSECRDCTR
jgi:hypothetical protein